MKRIWFIAVAFCAIFWVRCLPVYAAEIPKLSVEMRGDYECSRGDILDFSVVISNEKGSVDAKDLCVRSYPLPEGMTLLGNATSSGLDQTEIKKQDGGWIVKCPLIKSGEQLVVAYQCKVEKGCRAGESLTTVDVQAQDMETPVKYSRDIWVNEPKVKNKVQMSSEQWKQGDKITCQVLLVNKTMETIAKDIRVTSDILPEELVPDGEASIDILGVTDEILYPKPDGEEGVTGRVMKNRYSIQQSVDGWYVEMDYLPWNMPVIVRVDCMAQRDGSCSTGKWGNYAVLSMKQQVVNPNLAANDGRQTDEFRVGEIVEYQMTVNNINPLMEGRNLVIDVKIPKELEIQNESLSWSENCVGTQWNEDGFQIKIPRLGRSESVRFQYQCRVLKSGNGLKPEIVVAADCENSCKVAVSSPIWVNSPQLEISLVDEPKECSIGETASGTISVSQKYEGCRASDVVLQLIPQNQGMYILADTVELTDEYGETLECEIQVIGDNLFVSSKCDLGRDTSAQKLNLAYVFFIDNNVLGKQFLYSVTANSRENLPVKFQRYLKIE